MKLRRLLTLALAAAFLFVAPITAKADTTEGWVEQNGGWWYQYEDGTYPADETAWIDGEYYYFDEAGWLVTGGWINADVDYYDEDGTLSWTDNVWYYADGTGALQTGWQYLSGNWYYFWGNGEMADNGTYSIWDATTEEYVDYHFAPTGEMTTGWYWHENGNWAGDWYLSDANGVVVTGWQYYGGNYYYLYENGRMATGSKGFWNEETEEYDYYFFKPTGEMVTGWYNDAGSSSVYGDWYYMGADGKATEGWIYYGGAYYYIDYDGAMWADRYVSEPVYNAEGNIEDWDEYYLGYDGKMITGWYDASYSSANSTYTTWMYANADGTLTSQWVYSGGNWYYINDGHMVADTVAYCVPDYEEIPDFTSDDEYDAWYAKHIYVFDASGKMVTNAWYQKVTSTGTYWYHADANGNGSNGWVLYNGQYYYCQFGRMLQNTMTPDGFYVDAYGICR